MDQFCLSGRKEKQRWPFLEQAKRIPNGFCVGEKCWLKNKITNEITMTQIARDGDKRFIRADLKSSLKSPTWLLFGCRGPWGPVSCCSNHCPAILCFSLTCNAVMHPHHFKKSQHNPLVFLSGFQSCFLIPGPAHLSDWSTRLDSKLTVSFSKLISCKNVFELLALINKKILRVKFDLNCDSGWGKNSNVFGSSSPAGGTVVLQFGTHAFKPVVKFT